MCESSDLTVQTVSSATKFRIDPDALDCLMHYEYPGNIRELRNVIERALLLADGEFITRNELPHDLLQSVSEQSKLSPMQFDEIIPLEEMEQRYLLSADNRHQGDRKSLAKKLGVSEEYTV